MWAITKDLPPKYIGLKAQLYLAQGNTLVIRQITSLRPVRAAIKFKWEILAEIIAALRGRKVI